MSEDFNACVIKYKYTCSTSGWKTVMNKTCKFHQSKNTTGQCIHFNREEKACFSIEARKEAKNNN